MFENLSDRLSGVFDKLTKQGALSDDDVKTALREVRTALLEADVSLPVARDLAASGIRLNTIAPGLIDTPIYGQGDAAEAFKAKLGESVLFPKRLGEPDELARIVVECLTNPYMNGETVRVDGGIRMPPK